MNTNDFEVLNSRVSHIHKRLVQETSITMRKCGGVIPSIPDHSVGCQCGNVFIDVDYHRLSIDDYSGFEVLQKHS